VAGQLFLQSIYEALRTSPQWNECLFVVCYDEHGGFHDHVPPPKTVDDFAAQGFDQLGFRIPAFVVGPYVKQGTVVDTVFDHTSVYATLAALHGLPPLGARDAAAHDLLDVLDLDRLQAAAPRAGVELPPIVADEATLFAGACRGLSFHGVAVDDGALTGQPELERAFAAKHPAAAAHLSSATDGMWKEFVERARARGVWRPG
jgi:phospholipase C